MVKLYPVVAILCFACCSQTVPPPDTAIKAFNEQAQTATWLYQYLSAGRLAWKHFMQSAKDIQQRPGFNWFGYKEKSNWHFVFGYVEDWEFSVKFHYVIDSNMQLKTNDRLVGSSFTHPYFRALLFTRSFVSKYHLPPFDYYVRRTRDSSLHVWTLTALNDDSPARQCRGYHFIYDKDGSQLINQQECPSFDSLQIDHPRQLQMVYSRPGQSLLTALLYTMKYGNQFRQVVIESPEMKSVHKAEDGRGWIHTSVNQ